ncbi:hypothetical protein BEL04_10760 [Mucilaginibacter sp. PPCGB 2223]|uniref:hypothetical protein n=1 Tax=Mucilaginibacter sp. PPCGB 2223 TaxID=1886027 RepID=UPI0008271B73|nr:hypothetical protein [Mucilaginibacter sp. PPCGB 2223]OCX54697.1 hypothetical protein BEL04_10760 [Mucilaginibacter sp. PPCGB 2223]
MKTDDQINDKKTVLFFISFIIICILTLAYWFIGDREIDRKNLNINFAGKVESIWYDIKQFPTITVNDSTYYIGSGYDTDHQIDIGDSVIKRKGSDIYILIKHKTHKIIKFTR